MYNFIPEDILQKDVPELMAIWKQKDILMAKISKVSGKGGIKILLEFICSSVEFKLKKEILNQTCD